jgi:hypothetical protein
MIAGFAEVILKNQSDVLECLSAIQRSLLAMSVSLKVLSDWCETNWTMERVRGPREGC